MDKEIRKPLLQGWQHYKEIQLLDVTEDVISFAESLIRNRIVPIKAATDALHIGLACVNEMDYLLTWNCAHIANAQHYSAIRSHNLDQGYVASIICTPEETIRRIGV